MTVEGLEEDKGMSSCALEVLHVYPMREVRLGGQHVNVSGSTSGVFKDLKEDMNKDLEAPASPKERPLTEEEGTCRHRETLGRVLDGSMQLSSVVDVASSFVVFVLVSFVVFVLC
jgi:hypothetical protein